MKIALTVPADSVDERTLGAALEAATEVAQSQIESGKTQPLADAIASGLRWAPEPTPPGQESFDIPQDQDERGWADCDDLGPRWAAELRASGEDPDATAIAYRSRPDTWHVVVERGDGSIDDPSRWAGMGSVSGNAIPKRRPLGAPGKTVVGFAPLRGGGVRARLDVPIIGHAGEGVTLERYGVDSLDALARVCHAAGVLALWGAPDEVLAKLSACSAAIRGEPGDYADYGDFVSGIASQIDAGQAANLASAFLDPLGIHNLIAPLAKEFVSNYAQGLAQRGSSSSSSSSSSDKSKTNGDDPCPENWHWEYRNGVNVCVPDEASAVGAARGGARGGRGGGGRQQQGGGRGGRQQQQQQQGGVSPGSYDPTMHAFIDDNTGLPIDPVTGFLFDASTGLYYDPISGHTMDPATHLIFDPSTGSALGSYQGQPPILHMMASANPYAAQGYGNPGAMPGYAPQQYSFGYGGAIAPGPSSTAYPTAYNSPF